MKVNKWSVIEDFVKWFYKSHLHMNTEKTKDMVVDIRKSSHPPLQTNVQSIDTELVELHD